MRNTENPKHTSAVSILGQRRFTAGGRRRCRPPRVLYGTTYFGGANDYGVVYRLTFASGKVRESTLYSFSRNTGFWPEASPTIEPNGTVFGTTAGGVYKLTPAAHNTYTETTIATFGGLVQEPVTEGRRGALYGVDVIGGPYNAGQLFKVTPSGKGYTSTILHNFGSGNDGADPSSPLVPDGSGGFYGETQAGGRYGSGIVYKFTASGGYVGRPVHAFEYPNPNYNPLLPLPDGQGPFGGFASGSGGVIYGVTYGGGLYDDGTVFSLTARPDGTYIESLLHNFNYKSTDVAFPKGTVALGPGGVLYGLADNYDNTQTPVLYTMASCSQGIVEHVYLLDPRLAYGPIGTPLLEKDGRIIIATQAGGAYYDGDVIEITLQ